MKGYQMGNYKIRVKVEFVECDEAEQHLPMKSKDGGFEMFIDETDAISIDMCEKAALQTSHEAIRDALSEHLSEASKKKPWKKRKRK